LQPRRHQAAGLQRFLADLHDKTEPHMMERRPYWILSTLAAGLLLPAGAAAQDAHRVASPDGRNIVLVEVLEGRLQYSVQRDDRHIILPSALGFEFRAAPPLRDGLRVVTTARNTVDETWEQVWGEVARVRDHHNELRVTVEETAAPGRRFDLVVRAFDDGIAFRYDVPAQAALGSFEIMEELTEFVLADDAKTWWIPSDRPRLDRSEMLYSAGPMSVLDSVQTPLTMETQDRRTYLVIHEAHLVDYARMNLAGRRLEDRGLVAALAPMADGVKVRGRTPFVTPWRTIQLADRAADLVPAVLGLNLNPPPALEDVSWIRPMKYVGIWWGMHINTMTWGSGPRHGATTENAKRYIDFAAENGIGGVLVEGWNIGWDGDWIENKELFSFTRSHPDYDLEEVARYARERGVMLIMHNETSGGITNYEEQMDEAYALYESLGSHAIKSGYVADGYQGHAHWSQFMIDHWQRSIQAAARHRIMLNIHEPVHDTGERRTWPNVMTREGARGQEYNAWAGDGGNPPEHEAILFFTRLIAGPMDFTPGVFDILIASADDGPRPPHASRVRTTLAKQLALYVVIHSPMQMAADLIENYAGRPEFQFIRDVAVDWEQTRVLDARIGDYVVVARQERGGPDWYMGAITDEQPRVLVVDLDFLPAGDWVAEIYADGPDAHWLDNPHPVEITSQAVDAGSILTLRLAPGGGQAIRIRPAQ
jgi:alpha-glucosidase